MATRRQTVWVRGAFLLALLAGCASERTPSGKVVDGRDVQVPADAGSFDDQGRATADGGATRCRSLPEPPTAVITPVEGELYYEQVGLGGLALGEAAIVVGSDGGVALIDVGNDSHVDDIAERLQSLGRSSIRHIVVTHFHADHGDGLEEIVDRVGLTGRIVHRGLTNETAAANGGTFEELGRVVESNPGSDLPLCPDSACAGLGTSLELGDTVIRFLGADATMAGDRFERLVGPLHREDSNGENARSVVGTLEHGPFRMLFTGDLTGGGSDTDDVESFFAERLHRVSDLDDRGVDVLHAGHHGRDTSTNATWVSRLLPGDGRSRNAVMGISTAHLRSPHQVVLSRLEDAGLIWTTRVATGGATSPGLVDADGGRVVVGTREEGRYYVMQAIDEEGNLLDSRVFHSIRACE